MEPDGGDPIYGVYGANTCPGLPLGMAPTILTVGVISPAKVNHWGVNLHVAMEWFVKVGEKP